jgi:hypothetical protein
MKFLTNLLSHSQYAGVRTQSDWVLWHCHCNSDFHSLLHATLGKVYGCSQFTTFPVRFAFLEQLSNTLIPPLELFRARASSHVQSTKRSLNNEAVPSIKPCFLKFEPCLTLRSEHNLIQGIRCNGRCIDCAITSTHRCTNLSTNS